MLLQLPPEITLNIASHLEFKDKLNLKTTCHKLNDQITKAVLLEELNLSNSTYQVKTFNDFFRASDNIIQKLINDQFDGSLVKVLHLDPDQLSDANYSQLSNLFPNVNRIITNNPNRQSQPMSIYPQYRKDTTDPLIKWRRTITKISPLSDWKGLLNDVWQSKYPQLTELELHSVQDELKYSLRHRPPYSFFINAPLLTTLTLQEASLNLEVLEAMHVGFPLLHSLKLISPIFTLEEGITLPPNMTPANNVIYLSITRPQNLNTNGVALEYILKKYSCLKYLVFHVHPSDDYLKVKAEVLETRARLSSIDFEKLLLTSNERYRSYCAQESMFFSNLPTSIKSLTLNINNIENAVAALAKSDTKITMLDLLDDIRDLKRTWEDPVVFENFKKLTSLKTLRMSLPSSELPFTSEFVSYSVTRLVINIDECSSYFYFDSILSAFPSLEEIFITPPKHCKTIDECEIRARGCNEKNQVNGNTSETQSRRVYPNLRMINITQRQIHSSFFDFIKYALPNLVELDLNVYTRSLRVMTNKYDVSNSNLKRFNISFGSLESIISCIVTIQNISKRFGVDTGSRTLVPANRRRAIYGDNLLIEIVSDHTTLLKIYDFTIEKIGDRISVDY